MLPNAFTILLKNCGTKYAEALYICTMKRLIILFGFICGLSVLPVNQVDAQCPMCRMSAESNLKEGGSDGKGLNKGILYMLAAPYVFAGVLGYTYFKYQRKTKSEQQSAGNGLAQIEKGQLN